MRKKRPTKQDHEPIPGMGTMPKPGHVPPYLEECLEVYKLKKEDIKLSMMMDMTKDFTFGETWILATDKELCVINGQLLPKKGWFSGFYHIYPYEEYKDLVCDNLPTSAALYLTCISNEEKIIVGRISNSKAREAAGFIKYFNILREYI